MAKVIETNIESLIQDDKNFNKGTQFGDHLLEKSLNDFGLGRSILIDKNDRIIAGNKTQQKAAECGFTKVVVVETDGNTLVAVKRTDVDLDSPKGRELALADNATSEHNLEWDESAIAEMAEQFQFDASDWGVSFDNAEDGDDEEEAEEEEKKRIDTRLIVECGDVAKLSLLFSELQDRGFKVELKE